MQFCIELYIDVWQFDISHIDYKPRILIISFLLALLSQLKLIEFYCFLGPAFFRKRRKELVLY